MGNRVDEKDLLILLDRARAGDEEAFAALYRSVRPMARHTAQSLVHDPHTADDLVQEAFYLVLRAVRSGRGPTDSFASYVQSTVRRLAYRYFAKQNRTIITDDEAVWERNVGSVPTQNVGLASDAWARLPPRWRSILWLIEVDRYTPAELAPKMSMTPNAVSSLLNRARQALRSTYQTLQESEQYALASHTGGAVTAAYPSTADRQHRSIHIAAT
ncbi:RNA polymerase sigma factor [Phytoactinopolyspora halotolerans]|uniref:Sigma-70 family RNA polymerase sigma factor n=1 Tax=Phytoactinopolyspora halotolerans TaxID=1981512 RepID=A0A6L9SF36_9ACTN|nr:sigma-70 family RNA polymerase sigma factor [Phytoactinopolyspora halotolerans]NEE03274.1 sigma-70 family RNA polymerase sigma factor [Phytoactinopolyspora halotolerans]